MRISDWSSDVCSSDLVTRLWAAQAWKSFRRAIFQAQFVLALFGVCALAAVLLIGRWLIRVGPGEAYMAVWPLLIIQIIAVTLTLHGAPSRSALLAMGRQHQVLRIVRSEEHTSELQSLMRISYAVFCLKKKNNKKITK